MGTGGRSSAWVTKGSGDKVLTNYVEDLFIEALDMKYHGSMRKESQIADQLADGLTEAEVAIMVGTSERNVRRAVKKFREEAEDGED